MMTHMSFAPLATGALALGLAFGFAPAAHAVVSGSNVACSIANPTSGGNAFDCTPSAATITDDLPNPDFQLTNLDFDVLDIDFMGGWVDITSSPFHISTGFIDQVIQLDNIEHIGGLPLNIDSFSSTIAELTRDDLMLVDGLLTIDLSGVTFTSADSVGFNVAAVPVPASVFMLLGGLGGLGVFARRRHLSIRICASRSEKTISLFSSSSRIRALNASQ